MLGKSHIKFPVKVSLGTPGNKSVEAQSLLANVSWRTIILLHSKIHFLLETTEGKKIKTNSLRKNTIKI